MGASKPAGSTKATKSGRTRRSGKSPKSSAGRSRRRRRVRPGASPGTLRIDPTSPPPKIRILAFGETELEEAEIDSVDQIQGHLGRHPVTWVNVDGLGDAVALQALGDLFGLHPLALEDVAHTNQRPKMEIYEDVCFFIARMPVKSDPSTTEQVSLFLGKDFVLTFQEFPGDCFEPVRARIRTGRSRIRNLGTDYLVYALLDALLDSYFPLADVFEDRLDAIELDILDRPQESIVHDLHEVRRQIDPHRRIARSYREMFGSIAREETPLIGPHTLVFFRDCLDHAFILIDILDGTKEMATGLVELYMSSISNRMNEVMKVLTITATLFIPMTFIAGVYGMNFDPQASPLNMPELSWYWGYPFAWSLMILMAGGLLLYFRRKGWIGSAPSRAGSSE